MSQIHKSAKDAKIEVERLTEFHGTDLQDLCDATEDTIKDNNLSFSMGINRESPMIRERLEAYWKGILLVPQRNLIVGRLDGVIASSIQLEKPSSANQTQAFSGTLDHNFVAPWARGHGLAKELIKFAENEARAAGLKVLRLSVRDGLNAAIAMYEACGYKRWGTLDKYEMVDGKMLAGHFYYKEL